MKLLLILFSLFLLGFASPVMAQDATSEAALVQQEQKPSEYFLPYPGLLPDNPLYVFKVARDRIIGFLIHEPLKKAEFNLLQADKRLQAGVSLLSKDAKKYEIALTTISKAENYFEEAIVEAEHAKKQKILVSDFGYKLLAAQTKHHAVVIALQDQIPSSEQKKVDVLASRIARFAGRIESLLGEK